MEQTRLVNLPVVGRIQHGERTDKRVTELGYFIAKIDASYMKSYLEKFNEQYKGKQNIDIMIFNDEPLTMKYARYNQGGEVCSCMANSNIANLKVKNGWQQIQCDTYNCSYRQKNEQGKCACNRIGWLKFIIPSVCKDRIFLMRITGQTSLNRLDDYFYLQKAQGNPIKGQYTLFLKQESQLNCLGQTFNNYVLDIMKKEDFISNNFIPENDNIKDLSKNKNSNEMAVENDVRQDNTKIIAQTSNTIIKNGNYATDSSRNAIQITNNATNASDKTLDSENKLKEKRTTKTALTGKTVKKSAKNKPNEPGNEENSIISGDNIQNNEDQNISNNNEFAECYSLLRTYKTNIADKEYLVGEFVDMKDQISNIAIHHKYAEELSECDLGTCVKLDISEIKGRKFAMKIDFISKSLKKVAA